MAKSKPPLQTFIHYPGKQQNRLLYRNSGNVVHHFCQCWHSHQVKTDLTWIKPNCIKGLMQLLAKRTFETSWLCIYSTEHVGTDCIKKQWMGTGEHLSLLVWNPEAFSGIKSSPKSSCIHLPTVEKTKEDKKWEETGWTAHFFQLHIHFRSYNQFFPRMSVSEFLRSVRHNCFTRLPMSRTWP